VQGVTTNFVYDGLNPVQEKNGATVTANLLTGLGIDQVFTRTDGTGTREFFTDGLGSTVALANTSGAVQTSYTYEPFGGTTQTGSANTNSYKYTGREDDGTGLYYYRARYYSPRLQRFVSEDPIGFGGRDANLYRYVGGDPVSSRDPSGLGPSSFWACTILSGLWDTYQVGRDMSSLLESTRTTREMLARIDSELSQCTKDIEREQKLRNIRSPLERQLTKTTQEWGANTRQTGLLQVPQGAAMEAVCALAGIFGP
jgi:RHS repeat-associated protein